jgi:hypothetical protein
MGPFAEELDQIRVRNNSGRCSTPDSTFGYQNDELPHEPIFISTVRCRLKSRPNAGDVDENPEGDVLNRRAGIVSVTTVWG